MRKKVALCPDACCCPVVELTDEGAVIGEGENKVILKREEWNTLVEKIRSGELDRV